VAFEAIARSCLQRFDLNRDRFARNGDAEALHQVRVALRQLRSALSIFREIVEDEQFEHLRQETRWLAAATNEARDLDALIARMDECRRRSSGLARAPAPGLEGWLSPGAIADARVRRVARQRAWRDVRNPPTDRGATSPPPRSRAPPKLRRRAAICARSTTMRCTSADRAKKLRYAAWFFSGLFPGDRRERRAKRFIERMRALQDRLGECRTSPSRRDAEAPARPAGQLARVPDRTSW
jgi:inorganic triphosphatase YgiF